MKTTITAIATIAILSLSFGCSTMTTEQRIDQTAALANMAAYTGTALHLEDNEADAPFFRAAEAALNKLANDGNYTPAALAAALKELPVPVLEDKGKSTIIIMATVMLFDQGANRWLEPDSPEAVQKIAKAIRDGIGLALALHEKKD